MKLLLLLKNYIKLNPKIGYYELVKIFGLPINELLNLLGIKKYEIYDNCIKIFNKKRNLIKIEFSDGELWYYKYDKNGNMISWKDSYNEWAKWEHDNNGNVIYFENSHGFWEKYDEKSNCIYSEVSYGYKNKYLLK